LEIASPFPHEETTHMTLLKTSAAHFAQSEDGAVTVDWVVLTAALVGLGLATMAVVSGGVEDLSDEVSVELASIEVGANLFGGLSGAGSGWTPYLGEDDIAEPWPTFFGEDRFSDAALLEQVTTYAAFADAASGENDYAHDHYWAAHEEATRRGLDIPNA
jgi:hypothetical protein